MAPILVGALALVALGGATGTAAVFDGSARSERLTGTAGGDVMRAGPGNDRVRSGGGPDTVVGGSGNDRLVGQCGNDRISGNHGNDRPSGGRSNDRLLGGSGNDRIEGGPGRDVLVGGDGNDSIAARDGNREAIRCGAGRDSANVDFFETTITKCERVIRPPASHAIATGAPASAFGGVELTINSATPNATPEILAMDPSNVAPGPGQFFMLANVTILNGTRESQAIEVASIGASGDRVPTGERTCGMLSAPLSVRTLAPGESTTGNICRRMKFADFGRTILIVNRTGAVENGIAMRLG